MSTFCYRVRCQHQLAAPTSRTSWTLLPRPRGRRHLKVLYPPLVRRPLPQEEPSVTRRWLLILMALLFLQIYSEEVPDVPQEQHIYPEEEPKPPQGQQNYPNEALGGLQIHLEQVPPAQQTQPELGQKLHQEKQINPKKGPEFSLPQQIYPDNELERQQIYHEKGQMAASAPEFYSEGPMVGQYFRTVLRSSMHMKKPRLQQQNRMPLQEKWILGGKWGTLDKNHSDFVNP